MHDGVVALALDPQRDTDRVMAVSARSGVRIAAVAETHLHDDSVTGGVHLSRELGVDYLVNAADFQRRAVADGEVVEVGGLRVRLPSRRRGERPGPSRACGRPRRCRGG